MLASPSCNIACVANLSDHKASNHKWLKILTAKQMLQRLQMILAQVKAGNTSENLWKWNQTSYIFFVSSKRDH